MLSILDYLQKVTEANEVSEDDDELEDDFEDTKRGLKRSSSLAFDFSLSPIEREVAFQNSFFLRQIYFS